MAQASLGLTYILPQLLDLHSQKSVLNASWKWKAHGSAPASIASDIFLLHVCSCVCVQVWVGMGVYIYAYTHTHLQLTLIKATVEETALL